MERDRRRDRHRFLLLLDPRASIGRGSTGGGAAMITQLDLDFSEVLRRTRRARPVEGAPDYPCPCGALAGEYCVDCRRVLSSFVAHDLECPCDLCTSHD